MLPRTRSAARWCQLFGVLFPALVYCARRYFPDSISWPLPPHPQARQALAILTAACCIALLQVRPAAFARVGCALDALLRRAGPWGILCCAALGGALLGFARFAQEFTEILDGQPRAVLAGDGLLWSLIIDDPVLITSEPFGRWIPRCIWLLGRSIPLSGEQALRLGSVLGGMALIVVLLHYLPRLVPQFPFSAAFSLIFFSPLLIFFCGYPENTPFAYVFCMAYLLAALLWMRGDRTHPPWIPSLLLMLAMATHGATFFVYPAHLLLVLQPNQSRWRAWLSQLNSRSKISLGFIAPRQYLALGIPFALFGLCVIAIRLFPSLLRHGTPWYSQMFGGGDNQMFVSLWGSPYEHQDTLIGLRHLRNLVNLMGAMGPFLLLLPRIVRDLAHQQDQRNVLLAGLAGLLTLAILWNPDLGLPRDLDLFAFFCIPLQLLVMLWIHTAFESKDRTRLAVQCALSNFVFCVLPFLQ